MCGRYADFVTDQELVDAFHLAVLADDARLLPPSWNIAPTQRARIVRMEDSLVATTARWGLVPHWAKDPSIGARMINARSETVADKPAYRGPFRNQRCLVPASGYFEWQVTADDKRPHFIARADGHPLAMAGLWDNDTFTVLTTAARGAMADIHDRQPVMMDDDAAQAWLSDDSSTTDLHDAMAAPAPELAWHLVARDVGNVRNNAPHLIDEVEQP